jgi:hypothetical protein
MAYPTINAAVSKAILEAKMQVIDDFIKMLNEKIEIDEDLQGQFDEFKKSLAETSKAATKAANKATTKEPKKKRSATLFNLFVKEKQAQLKAELPGENGKTIIGMASKSWKEDPFALYIKEHTEKIKKAYPDSDNESLYNVLKDMYDAGVKPDEDSESKAVSEAEDEPVTKKTKGKKGEAEEADAKTKKTKGKK